MSSDQLQALWLQLHRDFERYETISFLAKLFHSVVFFYFLLSFGASIILLSFSIVAWLLDSIWKTFQARTEAYLKTIETQIKDGLDKGGFDFYHWFDDNNCGLSNQLVEYAKSALRPTLAVGYIPHIFISALILFLSL